MRSRYKKILLSTCLPAIALGTIAYSPVSQAGFEWTPPEKNEVIPQYIEDQKVEDYLIEETKIDVIAEPVEIEDDALQAIEIKVLDNSVLEENSATEVENTLQEEAIVIETIEVEATTPKAESEFEIEKQEHAPIVMYEQEEAKPDAEKPLIIDPYPEIQKTEGTVEVVVKAPAEEEPAPIIIGDTVEVKGAISWNASQTFSVIEGFGKEVPLALALRQIVPPQYAFSFNKSVNPGTPISWEGGKPWNEVLNTALAPLHIKADIQDRKVTLSNATEAKKKLNFQGKTDKKTPELAAAKNEDEQVLTSPAPKEKTAPKKEMALPSLLPIEEEVIILSSSPEDAMNTAIKETATNKGKPVKTEIAPTQEVTSTKQEAIVLKKAPPKPQHEDTSAIIDDLLKPLNSFEKKNEVEVKVDTQKEKSPKVLLDRKNVTDPGKTENQQPIILETEQVEKITEPEYIEIIPVEKSSVIIEETIDHSSAFIDPDPLNKLKNKQKQADLAAAPIPPKTVTRPKQRAQVEEIESVRIEEADINPMIPIIIDNEAPIAVEITKEQESTPIIVETAITASDMAASQEAKAKPNTLEEIVKATPLSPIITDNIAPAADIAPKEEIVSLDKIEPASNNRFEPSNKIRVWEAKKGNNLKKVIEKWSAKERIPLSWNSNEKYRLDFDIFISGTYQNALGVLFSKGLKRAPEYTLSKAPYTLLIHDDED